MLAWNLSDLAFWTRLETACDGWGGEWGEGVWRGHPGVCVCVCACEEGAGHGFQGAHHGGEDEGEARAEEGKERKKRASRECRVFFCSLVHYTRQPHPGLGKSLPARAGRRASSLLIICRTLGRCFRRAPL